MALALFAVAIASLLAWAGLLSARNGFWRADQRLGRPPAPPAWPAVTAIVPARNEAATIAETVKSVLTQAYPGRLRLVVVDDSSSDGTAETARAAGEAVGAGDRLTVIAAPALAAGWSGKLWALSAGIDSAAAERPDFYWFTDADIVHGPEVLARLAAKAESESRDLVSLMVRLRVQRFWERRLVPAFVFFFQMLYPFPAVNDPQTPAAGAAGGCILLRRRVYEAAGGFAAIKTALIDDCALAGAVQSAGGRLWLGLAEESHSLREAEGLAPLWRMIKRTAFAQLHYAPLRLAGTVIGLALAFLAPPVLAVTAAVIGEPVAAGIAAAAWLAMAAAYAPTLRYYARPGIEGLLLPAIALVYTAITLHSALEHWRGRGSAWKGRAYRADGPAGALNLEGARRDG